MHKKKEKKINNIINQEAAVNQFRTELDQAFHNFFCEVVIQGKGHLISPEVGLPIMVERMEKEIKLYRYYITQIPELKKNLGITD